jgi:uncharacterized membrane protein (DUF2068 family)
VRDLAYPLAVAIVVAVPALIVATLALLSRWAVWILRGHDGAGRVGLWATYAAVVGGAVWLALDEHRSIRRALALGEVAGLVGLATSLAVVIRLRRSARAGAEGHAVPAR